MCACCDWTRVRGNATHAWTHRAAHSCVKNTLLVFSEHERGRAQGRGPGAVGLHSPLCSRFSCLGEKGAPWHCLFPFPSENLCDQQNGCRTRTVHRNRCKVQRLDQLVLSSGGSSHVGRLGLWAEEASSLRPSGLMWFKQVSGVIRWGLQGWIGFPDEDVAWWSSGGRCWVLVSDLKPAVCYCSCAWSAAVAHAQVSQNGLLSYLNEAMAQFINMKVLWLTLCTPQHDVKTLATSTFVGKYGLGLYNEKHNKYN